MATLSNNFSKIAFILCFMLLSACTNKNNNKNALSPSQKVSPVKEQVYDAEKSQTDINLYEENSLTFLTSKLESMYSAVIEEYHDQKIFIKNFKKSQVAWKQYMESQLLARFPEDEEYRGGSSFGMCYALYKQQLIKERISSVNDWLIGFPEGEICGGSVKVKGY
ncbi:MAG: lysozyme inhibitor LprI family protein [Flavobacteriia bacterium]|nr:lysozyme inhibitor LprI family protein [Flavobacteriia bacterium]